MRNWLCSSSGLSCRKFVLCRVISIFFGKSCPLYGAAGMITRGFGDAELSSAAKNHAECGLLKRYFSRIGWAFLTNAGQMEGVDV